MATKATAVDKAALKAELLALLEAQLATARVAHASAIEGATHTEARAENDKDTRGLEQSYLARGQAQRVAELEAAVGTITALALRAFGAGDPVSLGALVTVEDEDGGRQQLFIAPHGGGSIVGREIQVVTPMSPLGRAVVGKRLDDDFELRLPGKVRTLTIAALA